MFCNQETDQKALYEMKQKLKTVRYLRVAYCYRLMLTSAVCGQYIVRSV